jgi:hypothetical protein
MNDFIRRFKELIKQWVILQIQLVKTE